MTKRKVCIIIITGISLILPFNYTVKAKEKNMSSNDTGRLTIIKSPQLREFNGIDHMSDYITKKFFTNRMKYYILRKILDSQCVLGPNIGDSITLDNVLPVSQSHVQIGADAFDLQPNIETLGSRWYGVTRKEAQVSDFTDFAMAVEQSSNSYASYSNLKMVSGSLNQPGIKVSFSDTNMIITRTSNVDSNATSSSGNVSVSAEFTNNYVTASNDGTTFDGPTSNWYTSDASTNSFNDSLSIDLDVPLISVFDAKVKNDNKELEFGTTFVENAQNFYNIIEQPNDSQTTAIWKTTPNMNKGGIQTAILQVTNTSKGYKQIKELNVNFYIKIPLKLIVPSSSDFGTYKLGSSNTVLSWNKASKVEVEGATHFQWDLSVALNSKSSLKDYIKIGDMPITETSQKVLSGTGPMSVTDEVSPDKFIKVDYTGVKQLRKDTGTLQWTLTPSTKEVSE